MKNFNQQRKDLYNNNFNRGKNKTLSTTTTTTSSNRNNNYNNRDNNNQKNTFEGAIANVNRNREIENYRNKNYVPFLNSNEIDNYLKIKLEKLKSGEDIVDIMFKEINQFIEIFSKLASTDTQNSTIKLVISIFNNEIFQQSISETSVNRLVLELKNSPFFTQILGFQKYLESINSIEEFINSIKLMELITSKYQDSIRLVPLDMFEIYFNSFTTSENNEDKNEEIEKIKNMISILKQKKTIFIKMEKKMVEKVDLIPNDQIVYKNRSVTPTLDELKSKVLPPLRPLKIGTYSSFEEYIDTNFNLLREDFIHPIRETLMSIEIGKPNQYYYKNVIFKGFKESKSTIYLYLEFSYKNIINWSRFSKLMNGSLLVLSCDGFKDRITFAIVEDRPCDGNKQEILISLYDQQDYNNLEYFFNNEFEMIESQTYFESIRNVLLSLQSIDVNELPLKDYLLNTSVESTPPKYIRDNPIIKLGKTFENAPTINITDLSFPKTLGTLDDSQLNAFQHSLSNTVSIVQGPPGTGKSKIGEFIFEVIHKHLLGQEILLHRPLIRNAFGIPIGNNNNVKSPILLLCYTNHALDQFLSSILRVTKNVVRIGSRSKSEEIKRFNIGEIIYGNRELYPEEMDQRNMREQRDSLLTILKNLLSKMVNTISYGEFLEFSGLSGKKEDISGLDWEDWVSSIRTLINNDIKNSKLNNQQLQNPPQQQLDNPQFSEDEEDEEMIEELLNNRTFDYNFNYDRSNIKTIEIQFLFKLLELENDEYEDIQDIFEMSIDERLLYYRYLLENRIRNSIKEIKEHYIELLRISKYIQDCENKRKKKVLVNADVVAATITGASRLKKVFDKINSKVVIIEEAAEVCEGHLISVLPKTTEHLILIGDHDQLRPSTVVYALAKKYHLDVSLFERLVKNNGQFCQLSTQRRMVPNISQFIKPIYPQLLNHESVVQRYNETPNINGMPSNLYFISHNSLESDNKDRITSKSNLYEAEFSVALADYLLKQGYNPSDIVILTPYSGQLLSIKNQINNKIQKGGGGINSLSKVQVRTVDQFQGEERDIVILSLVRSNNNGESGFVKITNRINVAISRARNAMYMIGNRELLAKSNSIWENMFKILEASNSIGPSLTLTCRNHPDQISNINNVTDFVNLVPEGGCTKSCDTRLDCGHQCPKVCHIYDPDHKKVKCIKPCDKVNEYCNHKCIKFCSANCNPCIQMVERTIDKCNHDLLLQCHIDLIDFVCPKPCEKIRKCGHDCKLKCGQDCKSEKCDEPVKRILSCGHSITKPCYNTNDKCEFICKDKLECGDFCSAECKDHTRKEVDGNVEMVHPKCSKICTRLLICGHQCNDSHGCGTGECPPCKRKCENTCKHSRCKSNCGLRCPPCLKPCKRGCRHVSICSKNCNEICDLKNCNERCSKLIKKCGHQCIGLCGEPCVTICKICNPDYLEPITQMKLEEFDDTDLFIQIHNGHVFHIDSLDQYMNSKQDDGKVNLKKCPSCNKIIDSRETPRYKEIINQDWKDFNSIKQITSKCEEEVGGTNHKLLSTNTHTGEIDGSTKSQYQPFDFRGF